MRIIVKRRNEQPRLSAQPQTWGIAVAEGRISLCPAMHIFTHIICFSVSLSFADHNTPKTIVRHRHTTGLLTSNVSERFDRI